MNKKYPLNYGCLKYFVFSMALFALINLLRVVEPALCRKTHLCVERLPDWLWSAFVALAVVALVMFVVRAYRDFFRQDGPYEDNAGDRSRNMQERKTIREI
ncbi:hypothetical protein ACO0LO_18025 [Undibacterium sp. TJN25]|uniref:hypothetical protein n=1 Tax=Undibacterium sp. TJN25 TaxID=3413056 RepID=UPI003BF07B19